MNENLKSVLIVFLITAGIFIGAQIIQQYTKVHYGGLEIADLYVKTVDVNGNPIAAYIIVFEPYDGTWKAVKEKWIVTSGSFEYVGYFATTRASGKQYRIDAMTSDMRLFGTVTVSLVKGRNEITIVLR